MLTHERLFGKELLDMAISGSGQLDTAIDRMIEHIKEHGTASMNI
jgi:hypothetical protein